MIIKKIIDFDMDQNCYIIYNEKNNKCIVIDCGNSYNKVINFIKENNLIISDILLTHCHYDHIAGLQKLKENNCIVIGSKNCEKNIKDNNINLFSMFSKNIYNYNIDKVVCDGENFIAAGIEVKCIETPGHTDCSVCYLIENNLFSGDTLFLRTIGRCDLPTGNYKILEKSIKEKLYSLDDNIKVYPGHGNDSTIGYEKKFNMNINL